MALLRLVAPGEAMGKISGPRTRKTESTRVEICGSLVLVTVQLRATEPFPTAVYVKLFLPCVSGKALLFFVTGHSSASAPARNKNRSRG